MSCAQSVSSTGTPTLRYGRCIGNSKRIRPHIVELLTGPVAVAQGERIQVALAGLQ